MANYTNQAFSGQDEGLSAETLTWVYERKRFELLLGVNDRLNIYRYNNLSKVQEQCSILNDLVQLMLFSGTESKRI